jgi:hypothetical protein
MRLGIFNTIEQTIFQSQVINVIFGLGKSEQEAKE